MKLYSVPIAIEEELNIFEGILSHKGHEHCLLLVFLQNIYPLPLVTC
jgi:hypothetical protein